jgi:hypothetical protein
MSTSLITNNLKVNTKVNIFRQRSTSFIINNLNVNINVNGVLYANDANEHESLRRSPKGTTENSQQHARVIHGWVQAPQTPHPRCRRRRERASVSVFEARRPDTPAQKCQRIFHPAILPEAPAGT